MCHFLFLKKMVKEKKRERERDGIQMLNGHWLENKVSRPKLS